MTRSPLFYPLNRGMDADAGGAADLQTDVMRFMAIISMCLVAIFALVQSIPLTPPTETTIEAPKPEQAVTTVNPEETTPKENEPSETVSLTRPKLETPKKRESAVALQRPAPNPIQSLKKPTTPVKSKPVVAAPTPNATTPNPVQDGFTLRFESDEALTRLVERDIVGLYAIGSNRTRRLSIDAGKVSFWTASKPKKFHEMDVATVPRSVISVWRRGNTEAPSDTAWGVSIPPAMSRQLDEYLSTHRGGSLIIGANGGLRLEP